MQNSTYLYEQSRKAKANYSKVQYLETNTLMVIEVEVKAHYGHWTLEYACYGHCIRVGVIIRSLIDRIARYSAELTGQPIQSNNIRGHGTLYLCGSHFSVRE